MAGKYDKFLSAYREDDTPDLSGYYTSSQVNALLTGYIPTSDYADFVNVAGDTMTGKLTIEMTTEQLRLGYDSDTYATFTMQENGKLLLDPGLQLDMTKAFVIVRGAGVTNGDGFKIFQNGESFQRFEFSSQGDLNWGDGSGSPDTTLIRRASNRNQFFGDLWLGGYNAQTVKLNGVTGFMAIKDGITAPATDAGFAQIYVDTADGDLKVKFGDGFVATLAAGA